jgi:hypothetical protein
MKQRCRDKQLYADQEQKQGADVIPSILGASKSPAGKPKGKRREDAEEYPHSERDRCIVRRANGV